MAQGPLELGSIFLLIPPQATYTYTEAHGQVTLQEQNLIVTKFFVAINLKLLQ